MIMFKNIHTMIFLASFLGAFSPSYAEPRSEKNSEAAIHNDYQSIPDHKFRECFIKYLCRNSGKEQSDIIVSKFKVSQNRTVPPGKVTMNLVRKSTARLAGYVRLNAIVRVNGIEQNNVQLSSWVDVFESVVCTSRDLKRKDIIKKDDVYLVRKNISRMPPETMSELSKVIGLMIKHNVKADSSIKEWMLEKAPVVERGDMVTVLAETGGLKVTVPGKIMETGYLGELVRVQNAMSKKEIYARVINHLTVMVHF
jgi:flagella basal body P-ring formation protein FlgA